MNLKKKKIYIYIYDYRCSWLSSPSRKKALFEGLIQNMVSFKDTNNCERRLAFPSSAKCRNEEDFNLLPEAASAPPHCHIGFTPSLPFKSRSPFPRPLANLIPPNLLFVSISPRVTPPKIENFIKILSTSNLNFSS